MSKEYWTQEDKDALETAQSYGELFTIAKRILDRMPRPRGQMCGPISTGGAGSVEANLKRFDVALEHILQNDVEVFNQMPFEVPMQRIKKELEPNVSYSMRLLEEFYSPIFENKLVDTLYFLPDWKTSRGANWEHDQAQRLGIEIIYLPEDLFSTGI
ncbi:DUF4406 domain-containing protein [Candidatus Campbellbacteria bacterium]|nr:MAG: DUF4406 domain-containing protein [Candidatus Campbellbacteria bacterium]